MNQQSRESARRGPAEAAPRRDPCGVITDEWVSALVTPGQGFARSAALSEMLYPLAVRMLGIAREVPFQPRRAAEIGAALVAANFVDVDALGRSLTVIARHTARAWNGPESGGTSAIQEAVAAGYIQALRERTLADAQAIFRAQLSHQVRPRSRPPPIPNWRAMPPPRSPPPPSACAHNTCCSTWPGMTR